MKNKYFLALGRLLISTVLASCFFIAQAARANSTIVISQIQITGGSGKTAYDFIELYNTTDSPINLKGYKLVKRTASGSADTSIKSFTSDACVPPKGYYLWANSEFTSIAAVPDVTTTGTISNDNGVALKGSNDSIIDSAAWGSASNGFVNVSSKNPDANQALLRADDGSFSIVSSSPRNSAIAAPGWVCPVSVSSSSSFSTGKGAGVVTKSSQVYISEILANPNGEDPGREQIELRNDGLETVNMEGWYLDDKNSGSVKDNAYKLPPQLLLRETYNAITIPKGLFSLNNGGGETINLYNAEKSLMDTVSYGGEAPEGESYQKIGGVWLWSVPTMGMENVAADYGLNSGMPVSILEFMPNPDGSNEGMQWVKFKNESRAAFSLKGYILDTAGTESRPTPNAWTLDDKAVVPAGGTIKLVIPEDKFTLTNEGHEALRFFNSKAKLVEQINFSQAPEGKSMQKDATGRWVFAAPLAEPAPDESAPVNLAISEILPNPGPGQEEFLEIVNLGDRQIQVKGLVVHIGGSKRVVNKQAAVEPNGYFVFSPGDLPANLRNSGQSLVITDGEGGELASLDYGQAEAGEAYALNTDGEYYWTKEPTPGQPNKLVLGEATVSPAGPAGEKAAKAKNTPAAKSDTGEAKKLEDKIGSLENKFFELSEALAGNTAKAETVLVENAITDGGGDGAAKKVIYSITAGLGVISLIYLLKWNFPKS